MALNIHQTREGLIIGQAFICYDTLQFIAEIQNKDFVLNSEIERELYTRIMCRTVPVS